jgi:hypothetical protein
MSLNLGDVLYRWVNFEQHPHHKFFVLVAKKPKRFFFINSDINRFILRSPELTAQQITVPSSDHLFLSHDSYANCINLIDTTEIRNQSDFNLNPELDSRGVVTNEVLQRIFEAVVVNETIAEEIREDIERQLKNELDARC